MLFEQKAPFILVEWDRGKKMLSKLIYDRHRLKKQHVFIKKYIFIIVILLIASAIFMILEERKTSKTPKVDTPVTVSIPKVPEDSTLPKGQIISDDEAHKIVWNLPEVQKLAEEIRKHGVRPFTRTESEPHPNAKPGTEKAAYSIYFGEDHPTHTVRVMTFSVDAYTKGIFVYDFLSLERIPLKEWRKREQ